MDIRVREDADEMVDKLSKMMETPGFASTPQYEKAISDMAFAFYSAVKYRAEK